MKQERKYDAELLQAVTVAICKGDPSEQLTWYVSSKIAVKVLDALHDRGVIADGSPQEDKA